ncbi:hypothetical protein ATDW_37000 (plasmid) [Asticcacaulis sp. DW145]|uniref:hypothetical protein n=1 Tax=Asticcacaulis sp. DW145 TaxID=3095608 RepID=UPI00308CC239|nr:hypothetical protein ATDW_37000 [Asticcacaulis sp. DW145]
MADYFTHFSCILELHTAENADQAMEIYRSLEVEYEADGFDVLFAASIGQDSPTLIWIRDDTSGDPDHAIDFVCRCAKALKLSGWWGIEWANTCSAQRRDAFGGGACVVNLTTAKVSSTISTNAWLTSKLARRAGHA